MTRVTKPEDFGDDSLGWGAEVEATPGGEVAVTTDVDVGLSDSLGRVWVPAAPDTNLPVLTTTWRFGLKGDWP